jgi:hypothetical protein
MGTKTSVRDRDRVFVRHDSTGYHAMAKDFKALVDLKIKLFPALLQWLRFWNLLMEMHDLIHVPYSHMSRLQVKRPLLVANP